MWENTVRKWLGARPSQLITIFSDIITLQVVFFLGVMVRSFWGNVDPSLYTSMAVFLCTGPLFMLILGSCEVPVPPPHKEVKKLCLGVTLAYLVILVMLFMTQISVEYSRTILLFTWLTSLVAVPVMRGIVRRRFCRKSWWGTPVFFLQSKEEVQSVWDELEEHPERGLRPQKCLDSSLDCALLKDTIDALQQEYVDPMFIWCRDATKNIEDTEKFEEIVRHCKNILVVVAGTKKIKKFWLSPRLLGNSAAFLVRQNLTDVRRLRVKRCMDILISSCALVVFSPVFLLLCLWIRLGSRGNAFYSQERIGQGGKFIRIFKFRSMVQDADAVLEKYLEENEAYREEWEETQKLRHDPRITSAGRFLRKTSLDELPQLFNVLLGNMTLVGPRPIVHNEIERYGDVYLEYTEVKPGITGLWQVSGRNNTTYEQRVSYDRYYVTNWSVWMDLWILMRTIPVALRGEGAY